MSDVYFQWFGVEPQKLHDSWSIIFINCCNGYMAMNTYRFGEPLPTFHWRKQNMKLCACVMVYDGGAD